MIEGRWPSLLLPSHAGNLLPGFPPAPDTRATIRQFSPFPGRSEPALCSGHNRSLGNGSWVLDEVPAYRTD
jgi:hypothetical protein